MGEGIANIVIWCMEKILQVFNDGEVQKALEVNSTTTKVIYDNIWDWVTGFAMGLIIVYFMWEMNSKWAFEGNDLNMKSLAGPFCKVAFAIILFNNSRLIADGMIVFYNSMITNAGGVTMDASESFKTEVINSLTEQCESLGIMAAVVILLPMLLVVLISYVLKFSFIYKALMIKFEFLFRIGFTPLAMADSFNGLNSNSMRWIKGFVGYGVYTAAFLLIPRIGVSMMNEYILEFEGFTGEGLDFILQVLEKIVMIVAVPFAELGVISAVKQLAKEAAG